MERRVQTSFRKIGNNYTAHTEKSGRDFYNDRPTMNYIMNRFTREYDEKDDDVQHKHIRSKTTLAPNMTMFQKRRNQTHN